jgi:NAD(P)-dependent dehydrogenase (short-subunit alcohol dehydrogenase family)
MAVLVTGGGTGIGAAVTRRLCTGGDQVAIFGRRAEPLRAVASQTGAVDVVCDVSDADQVAACVASVADRFGRLDGLVLNAGIMVPGGVAQSLAVEHAHQGLRANVVCPGWTVTEMADEEMAEFGASRGGLTAGEAYELVTALVPQRRAASADEVAAVLCWLLSDAASYVNGAVIPVDGGGAAVDVGTVPYDPRVQIRRQDGA